MKRAVVTLIALAFGGWISIQIWPHWRDLRDRRPGASVSVASVEPAIVAMPNPVVQDSLLGTDSSISEKALELKLFSTTPAGTLAESTATLGTDPKNPQTYAGGASLANGSRIVEIATDRIVLSLKGARVTMFTNGAVDSSAPSAVVAAATTLGGARARAQPLDEFASSREDLSEFLRTQPVFDNDRFVGLQILAGTKSSRLDQLGLQPGDVIRSVDGKQIDSDDGWQRIDDALSSRTPVVVGVEREGALVSLMLDGAKLVESSPVAIQTPIG